MPARPARRISISARALLAAAGVVAVLMLVSAQALEFDGPVLQQKASAKYGQRGGQAVARWLSMLSQQHGGNEPDQLRAVNDFWNLTVQGREDRDIWRQADYWATPLETLGRQAGDCEDYVIGKYFSLVHLGVPPEKLRFIYVRARMAGGQSIAHMVLGYYATPDADPLVLDSLMGGIRPASQRRDLTPVFSFNALGIYMRGAAPAPVDRIGRWRDLLARMQQEGFRL